MGVVSVITWLCSGFWSVGSLNLWSSQIQILYLHAKSGILQDTKEKSRIQNQIQIRALKITKKQQAPPFCLKNSRKLRRKKLYFLFVIFSFKGRTLAGPSLPLQKKRKIAEKGTPVLNFTCDNSNLMSKTTNKMWFTNLLLFLEMAHDFVFFTLVSLFRTDPVFQCNICQKTINFQKAAKTPQDQDQK